MVTLDGTILNVGEFNGNLTRGRLDYERAKQGLELIDEEMSALEESLKAYTGLDSINLPAISQTTELDLGDVVFTIKSDKRMKRPKYKEAVTQMETYLMGLSFLHSEGKTITGLVKQGRDLYISVDTLHDSFETIVAGVMIPEVKHTIRYDTPHDYSGIERLALPEERDSSELNSENARNYAIMDAIKPNLLQYAKAYEATLVEGKNPVTKKTAYSASRTTAVGVDWKNVVTTLISFPTLDNEGEIDILYDPEISKAQKEREMPFDLMYRQPNGVRTLYVSIGSVYDRIQELKGEASIISHRALITPNEVV